MKPKNEKKSSLAKTTTAAASISTLQAFSVHLICGFGLALALWSAHHLFFINLISHSSQTLRLIWIVECPLVILLYSFFRLDHQQCSYLKAVGRGILALPLGALANALGAVVLGAPIGVQYLPKTIYWSLLMSSLTFVPAAAVFGSSWRAWQRIFAFTKPNGSLDYMICIPAHGAIIGAWFGAWPMPLDWERPWQEWPICVTYGAMTGYLVGMVASFGFVLACGGRQHLKGE